MNMQRYQRVKWVTSMHIQVLDAWMWMCNVINGLVRVHPDLDVWMFFWKSLKYKEVYIQISAPPLKGGGVLYAPPPLRGVEVPEAPGRARA